MKTRQPTKPIPVRLDGPLRDRLQSAATLLHSNRAHVIRLAIHQLLPAIESGRLVLRVDIDPTPAPITPTK